MKMKSELLPRHIAFIMDGNGRWARQRGLQRFEGHRQGAETLDFVIERSLQLGIKAVTFYAFSYENWGRPKQEVDFLMELLEESLEDKRGKILSGNMRFRAIGELDKLPGSLQSKLKEIESESSSNTAMDFVLALSYSARREIIKASMDMMKSLQGQTAFEELDEKALASHLYTDGLPEVDLIIRTSGEKRLSNFLLWQSAYSELYFTDTLWPDFDKAEYDKALEDYIERDRRFGE